MAGNRRFGHGTADLQDVAVLPHHRQVSDLFAVHTEGDLVLIAYCQLLVGLAMLFFSLLKTLQILHIVFLREKY